MAVAIAKAAPLPAKVKLAPQFYGIAQLSFALRNDRIGTAIRSAWHGSSVSSSRSDTVIAARERHSVTGYEVTGSRHAQVVTEAPMSEAAALHGRRPVTALPEMGATNARS